MKKTDFKRKFSRTFHGKYDFVSNVVVLVFSLLMLFPLYWMFCTALTEGARVTVQPPQWIPNPVSFENFRDLFHAKPIMLWIKNSLAISLGTTVLTVIFSSIAAYGFSKLQFRGRNVLFYLLISTLMIPKEVYLIPLFKTMQSMNLAFTTIGIILPNVASPFGVFILKQFFDSLPNELRDSARIDGSGELRTFLSIYLPLAKPGIGALFILTFVRTWNDYLWQLVMTNSDAKRTLQLGIAALQNEASPNIMYKITGACVAAIPMIVIFLMFQKYFTKGITLGAVKG